MKKIISYEAEDGTVFSNYTDCLNYELNSLIQKAKNNLIFFNSDYQRLNYSKAQDIANVYHKSKYIYINNIEGIYLAKTLNIEFGFYIPEKNGYWYYDDFFHKWKCLMLYKSSATQYTINQLNNNIEKV